MDNRNLPAVIPKLPTWGDTWKKSKNLVRHVLLLNLK